MAISMDAAKSLLDGGIKEAQNLIKDPYKLDELLIQLENKLREVPAIGEKLSDLPVMIAMVKRAKLLWFALYCLVVAALIFILA